MLIDFRLLLYALMLTGLIYGMASGYSIAHNGNLNRNSITTTGKVALAILFPFTIFAVLGASLVIWW